MLECMGVLLSLLTRWYIAGARKKQRRTGFILTIFAASYWFLFFAYCNLWWLVLYNIINISIAIRGIRNNKGV